MSHFSCRPSLCCMFTVVYHSLCYVWLDRLKADNYKPHFVIDNLWSEMESLSIQDFRFLFFIHVFIFFYFLFIYLLGFIYTNIYNNRTNKQL